MKFRTVNTLRKQLRTRDKVSIQMAFPRIEDYKDALFEFWELTTLLIVILSCRTQSDLKSQSSKIYTKTFASHLQTRRPLSTGIFSAIKTVTLQPGFEPITSCLAGRRTTNCDTVTSLSFQ